MFALSWTADVSGVYLALWSVTNETGSCDPEFEVKKMDGSICKVLIATPCAHLLGQV